jgi:hypothetical protein
VERLKQAIEQADKLLGQEDRYVITDNGSELIGKDDKGKVTLRIPRFGVWDKKHSRGKPQVIDTGNDVEALKKKYKTSIVIRSKR